MVEEVPLRRHGEAEDHHPDRAGQDPVLLGVTLYNCEVLPLPRILAKGLPRLVRLACTVLSNYCTYMYSLISKMQFRGYQ